MNKSVNRSCGIRTIRHPGGAKHPKHPSAIVGGEHTVLYFMVVSWLVVNHGLVISVKVIAKDWS